MLSADGRNVMDTENDPVKIDKNVFHEEPEKTAGAVKNPSPVRWSLIVSAIGVILIAALLLTDPENGQFIDSPPPEEQAERDSIYSWAGRIEQYREGFDSLPGETDVSLPSGFAYEKEDELTWSIETEAGLYYSSDIDLEAFARGEL